MRLILIVMVVASLSTSCVSTFHLKNKTYAPLVFDTITAKLDGNFTAEASLEFRFGAVKNYDYKRNFKQLYMSEYGYATNLTGKVGSMWNYRKAMLATRKDPTYNLALYNLAEKYPNIDYWTNIRVERTVHRKRSVLLGFLIKYLNIATHTIPQISTLGLLNVPKLKNPYMKSGIETVKVTATGVELITDK